MIIFFPEVLSTAAGEVLFLRLSFFFFRSIFLDTVPLKALRHGVLAPGRCSRTQPPTLLQIYKSLFYFRDGETEAQGGKGTTPGPHAGTVWQGQDPISGGHIEAPSSSSLVAGPAWGRQNPQGRVSNAGAQGPPPSAPLTQQLRDGEREPGFHKLCRWMGGSPRSIPLVYLPSCALRETQAGREQAAPSEQVAELG